MGFAVINQTDNFYLCIDKIYCSMNIQQLEYLVSVDNHRHFGKAAEACGVTQPTLSTMVQKLEDELDVKIFDRSCHPVQPTSIGRQIIEQSRVSLKHFRQINEIVESEQNVAKGNFTLGVIPTIAPFLVPELLSRKAGLGKDVELTLRENTTGNLIKEIVNRNIDGGLMAGPIHNDLLIEYPIYYEKFYAYVSKNEESYACQELDLNEIDISRIWLLENVHCLRGQIENLCQMKKKASALQGAVKYDAGSIDTLINIVDYNDGITVIPEMSAMGLNEERQENLRTFKNMTAVREVCLVVSKEYVRKRMLHLIIDLIRESVPKMMQNPDLKKYVIGID